MGAKRRELDFAPEEVTEEDRRAAAFRVWSMVQDWQRLVDSLVGAGQFRKIKEQAKRAVTAAADGPPPDRTVGTQVAAWRDLLRAACQAGQMSESRYDAYCRNISTFVEWAGENSAIYAIDEAKPETITHLSLQVSAGSYSPAYAHTLLMTARQFISRLAELRFIPLPGNIRSRRFRFGHSAPAKIETFAPEEVRAILAACDGFSERTKLYLLLMLNCGMDQNDIAELRQDEVGWSKGTVTRARSKTRGRGGPVVTYMLWPETFALLKEYRAKQGELALTTDEDNPLGRYWLVDGEMRRYDVIQSAWSRLAATRR